MQIQKGSPFAAPLPRRQELDDLRTMTSSELLNLLLSDLVRNAGRTRQHWRRLLGDLRLYSTATQPHCNWDICPTGGSGDLAAIEQVLDRLRAAYPQIQPD